MTREIKCPNCGKSFTIDEASYAEIQKQVHDAEFDRELESRLATVAESSRKDLELAKKSVAESYEKSLNAREREIAELKGKLSTAETKKRLAVSEATASIERQLDAYKARLALESAKSENALSTLKSRYESELKSRDELVAYYKDLKQKMSTKMVGETLEQHCEIEFNKIRAIGFKNAYFEKDNDARTGSKGDYIYRESDPDGNEIISIMFEMKNESDKTATKHKNRDFFKELDKDRREKHCEYAVLVSLLESDSDYYNSGIVDVSYESGFEKMYVVRPQCFIPIITILRNAALTSLETKRQLAIAKNQTIDITNFESSLNDFKSSFSLNSTRATANFNKAIEEIDKTIKNLENVKDDLEKTAKNFNTANRKLEDLTIKRLTRGNETMTKLFEDLKK